MVSSVPTIIKVFGVFFIILLLNRLKVRLSFSLLIGSALTGFWINFRLGQIVESALNALTNIETISLVLIVGFIIFMSRIMEAAGHMERVVSTFAALSRDVRIVASEMPALIGLLPMPGDALFSAPVVETALCRHELSGEKKAVVNYWVRQLWEYWWPLCPGVVLAVGMLDVDTWRFMIVMAPMTLITVLSGVIFILRPTTVQNKLKTGFLDRQLSDFTRSGLWLLFQVAFTLKMLSKIGEASNWALVSPKKPFQHAK